jgi:hypothetical protein
MARALPAALALLLTASLAPAAKLYVYVGEITPRAVTLGWGTAEGGGNSIGRGARSHGRAVLRVGTGSAETSQSWATVGGLAPDTTYPYRLDLDGKTVKQGHVRTHPESASRLAFLVFGDWGTGDAAQRAIAGAMRRTIEERRSGPNPVRFILSTGDNIYAFWPGVLNLHSGSEDTHWKARYYEPYEAILGSLPVLPVLGNHDGNESEKRADLSVYLDNFFFPGGTPARWYAFSYAGLADFFALDSTTNTESGPPRPAYLEEGEQFAWLKQQMAASRAPWKIPFLHHPVFNAGPRHVAFEPKLAHFVEQFARHGVKAVFQGHEHNLQFSAVNERSRGIRFIITGAGGELRPGRVTEKLPAANIEGWAAQRHFLLVEIEARQMRITPLSAGPVVVTGAGGRPLAMPLEVRLP